MCLVEKTVMRVNIISTVIEVYAKCHKNTKERQ